MIRISKSVIPQGWNNNTNTQNKPVDNSARTTYPNGLNAAGWAQNAQDNMKKWYEEHRVGKNHISQNDLHRIDNMNFEGHKFIGR